MVDSGTNNLTDESIIEIIERYVDEHLYDYAVMIDGEWGCGKTYFVTHTLEERLKEHEDKKAKKIKGYKKKNVIYTTLYGIKSLDDISKQLYMEIYLKKDRRIGKLLRGGAGIVSSMIPIAFDIAKPFIEDIEVDSKELSKVMSNFLSITNSILIFDDLERCDCPINEVLGYINSFVEHEKMKVILVANQLEIGRSVSEEVKGIQYLLAANGDKIEFGKTSNTEKNDISALLVSKPDDQETLISIEQLEERANVLFGQSAIYERLREKLIGTTLYYSPDLEKIFESLIRSSSINIDLKNILITDLSFLVQYMTESKHKNLRTFLSKIEVLYKAIYQLDNQAKEKFFSSILRNCFKICVCHKAGTYKAKWEKRQEYGNMKFSKNDLLATPLAFRFVDDFVLYENLDLCRVERMLKMYEEQYINNKYDTSFYKLEGSWYLLEDEEIEKYLDTILKELSENKYEVSEYERMIFLLLRLEQIGFSSDYMEEFLKSMRSNLQQLDHAISFGGRYYFEGDDKMNQREEEIIKELNSLMDSMFKDKTTELLNEIMKHCNGWGEELHDYVNRNRSNIFRDKEFISKIDMELLINQIENSSTKDMHYFHSCILDIYKPGYINEIIEKEREYLQSFLNCIERLEQKDFCRTKRMQLGRIEASLENVLRKDVGKVENYRA